MGTGDGLQITDDGLQITDYWGLGTDDGLQITDYWVQGTMAEKDGVSSVICHP